MTGSEIRRAFLSYFEARGHRVVPSASLVPERDPTLMFTNAGMVPFKRVFLGEEVREYKRVASVQKCMRVSGKHNDLENVGRTPRHHTFFEMLGNFSFGDYFKEEAIRYAWELLTDALGLAPERLVVSVFRDDEEAWALWRDTIGLDERRIFRLDEKENFWQMGDTGPCGPCSEIHLIVDEAAFRRGADPSSEGFLELWNLVFMQFDQAPDGERRPLPAPSIDTGMGLERLAAVLQGVESTWETDLFQPLIQQAAGLSGVPFGRSEESDVSLKVVADHARAVAFLIGDGVRPTNEGRGYVLRRVLRRAARHGVLLGLEDPFLHALAGRVVEEMGEAYPELVDRRAYIEETVLREEERFAKTLGRGLELLDREIEKARRERRGRLGGEVVFKLYDTYGFPVDLTEDILASRELGYDREAFESCMREQSERARAAWKGSGQSAPSEVYGAIASVASPRFCGYERLETSSTIAALLRDGAEVREVVEGESVEIVSEETPFYAQSGGQVGDQGEIEGPEGRIEVEDTQRPVEGLIVHLGRVTLGRLRKGERVGLRVDRERRAATVRNHSGTHLFHWALREVLGPQVTQAGSLVTPERLRFDFSFDRPLSEEEIRTIEDRVNRLILENLPGAVVEKPYQKALEDGAMAIFEEKYGDLVRVVSFGPSTELCGGTHVRATGDIGGLRVISQSAVGAGVRRIEALTGIAALEHARRESTLLREAAAALRTAPAELPDRIHRLLDRQRELEREVEKLRSQLRRGVHADPMQQVEEVAGRRVIMAELPDASPKELRSAIDELKQRLGSGVVLLVARQPNGKVALAIGVTADLTAELSAGELVRAVAEAVAGTGGGRADFAQAGGSRPEGIPQAFERLRERLAGAPS
ncbi:MAG: alanine--tRNA ligase [Myxococcota bacterium]